MTPALLPTPRALSRRTFLRGTGVAMALPLLDAMQPAFAADKAETPRRMIGIETNMGILPQFFFPEKAGKDYVATPYLQRLAAFRHQLTVFSGVSHPGVTGGHAAEKCFLTGTPHPERGGFRNWVSVDQLAAEHLGPKTRYPSLVLGCGNEGQTLSYTRSGAPIPIERSPRKLFEKLFVQGKPAEVAAQVEALRQGRSTLDFVGDQAKRLNGSLAPADKQRLDQYFSSVRDLEQRLAASEAWEQKDKPKVTAKPPEDEKDGREFARQMQIMFDTVKLALETDSTRLVTIFVDTTVIHNITHHGNRPEVLAELKAKESGQFDSLAGLLKSLSSVKEQDATLLDRTMVLYGTCMGSANSHSNNNLPVLLAGGGFKHGQHLAFDTTNNYPLTNLFVSMLQRLGMEVREFSTGKGTMRGLEMV
ncbi:Secreted protein containing DUF1552 OS=Rhodopirellula europaea SH398 GN=RESH_04023 PE=4 SV=1: HXXSHH [Gemmataceae bacterium]|nr:Secreted protein containing DUF1552 OS=Rhodopirellula europaea SH398 GN=RESH_04023 PE=4 SV=1: HXXSHH [Gemmataceae bacterium]VTT98288.1 Secreted protein containing DUF1552 OS=Rhodopirellula europaea SH398 GN=RESH_04023 PE=4 SV=1: HXXSHH [Gemmataceae bacterium]